MPFRPKASRFWHFDFQIKGRRFHGSCGTESFEEAKAIEAAARVKAKSDPIAKGIFTLAEATGTYCADISQHQPSYRTTLSQCKAILATLGARTTLPSLTNADLMRLVRQRRAKVSNGTVNRELDTLARAVRHMVKYHRAEVAADLDFTAPKLREAQERIRELTWAEQTALFQNLRVDLHPFVKFALMTGARKETITGLRWSDIDHDNARIRFALKGDLTMFFPINNELRALLSALPRATLPDHAAYVFTYLNHRTSTPLRQRIVNGGGGLSADFQEAVKAAEIPNLRFHDLRHTFASRLLRQSGNLKLVSRLLGHTSVETTTRYAHVLQDDLAAAMADFSALSQVRIPRKSQSANIS